MNENIGMVHIVGGGLAGCEAAWQLARQGIAVRLYEMRPLQMTGAHKTQDLAELVCSNSLKSTKLDSAPGRLKEEMAALSSIIVAGARQSAVSAGQALGVDRAKFSAYIQENLQQFSNFELVREEITELPTEAELIAKNEAWVVATGPLSSDAMMNALAGMLDLPKSRLYFYDSIAPTLAADSIDMSQVFFADRYGDQAQEDYLNIPIAKDLYYQLIEEIKKAQKVPLHSFEKIKYFEACLPIEVMVERGPETLRFGPLKPVGLIDPKTQKRAYAVLQLRRENAQGSMYSLVGFQTKMTWPEQKRILSMLPGLSHVEILRYGSIHRNSYLNSPKLLANDLSFKANSRIFLAGQITGVEGYTESACIGLLAGRFALAKLKGQSFLPPDKHTMMGALLAYVCEGGLGEYSPMNANLGLLPAITNLGIKGKQERRLAQIHRAEAAFSDFLQNQTVH